MLSSSATSKPVLWRAGAYAYGRLMEDLTPWFLIGFALSATLALALPADFFGTVVPSGWPAMLIMLVAGFVGTGALAALAWLGLQLL